MRAKTNVQTYMWYYDVSPDKQEIVDTDPCPFPERSGPVANASIRTEPPALVEEDPDEVALFDAYGTTRYVGSVVENERDGDFSGLNGVLAG